MTHDQLMLDVQEIVLPETVAGATLEQRFVAFHDANPWVFQALETLTADEITRGNRRIGVAMLFEVLRWHYGRRTVGDPFRLNNSFRAFYARLLMQVHPEWDGLFETRKQRAA